MKIYFSSGRCSLDSYPEKIKKCLCIMMSYHYILKNGTDKKRFLEIKNGRSKEK